MTTTLAPITLDTSCPAWCTEHRWSGDSEGHAAIHEAPVEFTFPPVEDTPAERQFMVTPTRWVMSDGAVEDHVYLHDAGDGYLATGAEVRQLAAALLRAGQQAFGEVDR